MSESSSDDDWFEKDVGELVDAVKRKPEVQKRVNSSEQDVNSTPRRYIATPVLLFDQDFGGSYNLPSGSSVAKSQNSMVKNLNPSNKENYFQRLSSKKLIYISEQEPLEAFLEVFQPDAGFFECFEEKVPNNYIEPMCIILAKICELPFQEYTKDLLSKFMDSDSLIHQFKDYITEPTANIDIVQKFLNICWKVQLLGLRNENLQNLLHCIKIKFEGNFVINSEVQNILNALEDNAERFKEIYPTIDDLRKIESEEVKPNIIAGKYPSVQEYIRTHLSLLREDFVAPLREFTNEIKKFQSKEELPSKHIYKSTRFLLNDVSNLKTPKTAQVSLLVDLRPDERDNNEGSRNESKKSSWINSTILMPGTLLCFTSGLEFSDLILAVVSHRENEMLLNGYVCVKILKIYNVGNIFNRDFLMLESEVYFEPYHHVYRVLQGLREQNFPLKNFIVNIEQNLLPPDYLKGSKKHYYKYDIKRRPYYFDPRNFGSYPPRDDMEIDQSQLSAYQNALSRKFSLIQGPPGTGKTFIGLKIISTLLENVDSRILIVCYTNHALDQFLGGILASTTDIVRLGTRSKHELLDIKHIAEGAVKSRDLNVCFYNAKLEYSKLMEDFEQIQKDNDGETYEKVLEIQKKLQKASEKLDELKQIFDYKIIKNKKVIGMTTTYAARSNLLLQLLKTPIVIVEEAAEVLESHIVATLTQFTEHVILIGDHQQLRPTTSVYRLSEKFKMDISLFERMINNNMHCVCLNTQHRMRPEIANLLRPTIYSNLKDAENVQLYENIRGIAKNMFFVNHNSKELRSKDETTKRNPHEVGLLLELADYLIMQDYRPEDIVILSTYNGQMFDFFNERKKYRRLEKVRITVVDNFQGEESKIILLSLVRNNNENRIGYLAMKNRICVALSRAKEGFYVSGAIEFLASQNSTWKKIKKTLEDQNSIGDALPIVCQLHGNTVQVQNVEDFKIVKSGRCCEV